MLNFIKTRKMLQAIDGFTSTTESILDAIFKMNEESDMLLGRFDFRHIFYSQCPKKDYGVHTYCEHRALSMDRPGIQIFEQELNPHT